MNMSEKQKQMVRLHKKKAEEYTILKKKLEEEFKSCDNRSRRSELIMEILECNLMLGGAKRAWLDATTAHRRYDQKLKEIEEMKEKWGF